MAERLTIRWSRIPRVKWSRLIDLNLRSVYLVSKEVLPIMIKQGGGAIVNTVTINAFLTQPGTAAYSAAKAGVFQLTSAMALDYAKHKIRVNGIAPGEIHTPLWLSTIKTSPTQAGDRLRAEPDPDGQVRRTGRRRFPALWLASDEAWYITGQVITVDGGNCRGIPVGCGVRAGGRTGDDVVPRSTRCQARPWWGFRQSGAVMTSLSIRSERSSGTVRGVRYP